MLSIGRTAAGFSTSYASGVEVVASYRVHVPSHRDEDQAGAIDPRDAVVRLERALRSAADELLQEARNLGVPV